jgi:hypothetical protein
MPAGNQIASFIADLSQISVVKKFLETLVGKILKKIKTNIPGLKNIEIGLDNFCLILEHSLKILASSLTGFATFISGNDCIIAHFLRLDAVIFGV